MVIESVDFLFHSQIGVHKLFFARFPSVTSQTNPHRDEFSTAQIIAQIKLLAGKFLNKKFCDIFF